LLQGSGTFWQGDASITLATVWRLTQSTTTAPQLVTFKQISKRHRLVALARRLQLAAESELTGVSAASVAAGASPKPSPLKSPVGPSDVALTSPNPSCARRQGLADHPPRLDTISSSLRGGAALPAQAFAAASPSASGLRARAPLAIGNSRAASGGSGSWPGVQHGDAEAPVAGGGAVAAARAAAGTAAEGDSTLRAGLLSSGQGSRSHSGSRCHRRWILPGTVSFGGSPGETGAHKALLAGGLLTGSEPYHAPRRLGSGGARIAEASGRGGRLVGEARAGVSNVVGASDGGSASNAHASGSEGEGEGGAAALSASPSIYSSEEEGEQEPTEPEVGSCLLACSSPRGRSGTRLDPMLGLYGRAHSCAPAQCRLECAVPCSFLPTNGECN
jgi:hypothetical protein